MSRIRTVLGDITPQELGVTDAHDHLIMDKSFTTVSLHKDFLLNDVKLAISELRSFQNAGGNSFVDMAPIGFGRNINSLLEIAKGVPVHIIAATGFHKAEFYEPYHWIHDYSVDQIGQLVVGEITEGIDVHQYGGPFLHRSNAKAGVIKAGAGYNCISRVEEKLLIAAARAHLETGAPISTHTEMGTMALEQLDILQAEGVDPSNVIVGHLDRNPDSHYHREVAKTGAFLQYDTPSRIKYHPESVLVELISKMVEAGFSEQILLGGDMGRRTYLKSYGGGPGYAYILERFIPRLREEGIAEEAMDNFLINNPKRAFAF